MVIFMHNLWFVICMANDRVIGTGKIGQTFYAKLCWALVVKYHASTSDVDEECQEKVDYGGLSTFCGS